MFTKPFWLLLRTISEMFLENYHRLEEYAWMLDFCFLNHLQYSNEEVHFQCVITDNDVPMKPLCKTVKYAF